MRFLLLILACSLLGAVEPVPVPMGPVAQRALDLTVKHRQFFDWALVEAFRSGEGKQPWRADAERLLGDLGQLLAANEADPHLSELVAAGRAVVGAGCDDPLVLLRVGILLGGGDGAKLITGSIAPLRTRTPAYSGLHLVSALRRQVEPRSRKLTAEALRDLPDIIVTASREALAAPCGRGVAVDRLIDWFAPLFENGDLGDEAIGRTLAALEAPGCDPALSGVLRGHVAINAAWKARGGGWASSVTEKGWQGFRAGLAEARQALTAAWQALPESASAASLMITVSMGDGSNEKQVWFDRAIAADPGCLDAWKRMSNALSPRWGGSTQQLLALAQRAVADARPGNRLAGAANHVLFIYVDENGGEAAAWAEIARLDATCPPQPGPGQTFRAMGVAWHAGRKAQALELFAQLGGTAAPAAALDAAPFGLRRGMRLLATIERARLGQATPRLRAIPADGTPHRKALHAPSYLTLLPAWWQKHGVHQPEWDARIVALLEKHAAATAAPALDLVTA
ncbi:MAG TPA: hypothetical protein DCS97_02625, partial [Planctomycetes bacterium]|nr:hypothetical protein [Planctomycetota bacterium]